LVTSIYFSLCKEKKRREEEEEEEEEKTEMEVEVSTLPWAERLRSRFTSVLSLPTGGKRRHRSRIRRGVVLFRGGDALKEKGDGDDNNNNNNNNNNSDNHVMVEEVKERRGQQDAL